MDKQLYEQSTNYFCNTNEASDCSTVILVVRQSLKVESQFSSERMSEDSQNSSTVMGIIKNSNDGNDSSENSSLGKEWNEKVALDAIQNNEYSPPDKRESENESGSALAAKQTNEDCNNLILDKTNSHKKEEFIFRKIWSHFNKKIEDVTFKTERDDVKWEKTEFEKNDNILNFNAQDEICLNSSLYNHSLNLLNNKDQSILKTTKVGQDSPSDVDVLSNEPTILAPLKKDNDIKLLEDTTVKESNELSSLDEDDDAFSDALEEVEDNKGYSLGSEDFPTKFIRKWKSFIGKEKIKVISLCRLSKSK